MAELNAAWAAEVKRAAGLRTFRRSLSRQQEQVCHLVASQTCIEAVKRSAPGN